MSNPTEKLTAKEFKILFNEARMAGIKAVLECKVTPMIVQQHSNMADDSSPVTKSWFVEDGVCGFASINIRPGNCPAANYAKKHLGASKAYYGGVSIWVHEFNQSLQKKEAYASAFPAVLHNAGIWAHCNSRMD